MAVDKHGRSHKPSGLPQHVAGTYDTMTGVGSDSDLIDINHIPELKDGNNAQRKIVYRQLDSTSPCWYMMESLLKASKPGKKDDYRDEPLATEEETQEILMRERNKMAKYLRNTWMKHGVNVLGERPEEIAEQILLGRLYALRRSCATDPTKGYTTRFMNYALSRPLRMESILAKPPYSVPAHHQRVGSRYQKALKAWSDEHPGRNATETIRDRIWDETIDAYCQEKEAKGVSYGRGMTRSDGTSARSDTTGVFKRAGQPVNGRKEFEEATNRAWREIDNRPQEFGDVALKAGVKDVNIAELVETAREQYGEEAAQKVLTMFGN